MDTLRFDDRVAIVTGAGGDRGLGRSHARLLAARGAKVVVNDLGIGRDGERGHSADAAAVAREIVDEGGEAIADAHSVAEEDGARAVVERALDTWGRVDIVVNNASVGLFAAIDEATSRDVERVIGVHLMGAVWMCRAAWPHMRAAGHGRIVNTTSGSMFGLRSTTIYSAAKFGVFGLTRGLAVEGAPHDIRVNAFSPGAATNSMGRFFEFGNERMRQTFIDTYRPELVSPVVGYLAHESCKLNGALFDVSGGDVAARLIGRTRGYHNDTLTIEDVRDNLTIALDDTSLTITSDPRQPADAEYSDFERMTIAKPYVPSSR